MVALEQRIINKVLHSTASDEFLRSPKFEEEGFVTYFGVPLIAKGQVQGVLEIFHRSLLSTDPDWLSFLKLLGGQAAIAIDNASLFNNLQQSNAEITTAYDATIDGWSRALDMRDRETDGHTQRVTEMTVKLARKVGMLTTNPLHIRRGATLHDIGKMGIPDHILHKPGPLSEEEWAIMRKHPLFASDLLSPIEYLRPARDIPCYHHERWDGSGYPIGLKGEEIPLAARCLQLLMFMMH